MEIVRPSWDEYFLHIAEAVSQRGDCRRSRVGAVLVDNKTRRILATGYNGVRRGERGCLDGECPRGLKSYSEIGRGVGSYDNCIATHAESNCLSWWFTTYPDEGYQQTMYITRRPCSDCEALMRDYRISAVVWNEHRPGYRFEYLDLTPNKGL